LFGCSRYIVGQSQRAELSRPSDPAIGQGCSLHGEETFVLRTRSKIGGELRAKDISQ
jgi:hypothetical protein